MNDRSRNARRVDPALKAAGWGVVEGSRVRREYPITLGRLEVLGPRGKALSADYVLEYRNMKPALAAQARAEICNRFSDKQQAFLEFVPSQYVKVGVEELDQEKLASLLRLKYNNATADARELGEPKEIRDIFAGFQKFLYDTAA